MARQYEGTPLEVIYDSEAAPTVAAQQCGLEAVREAAVRLRQSGLYKDAQLADRLEAATPPDEPSGNPGELIDKMAEAIRGDTAPDVASLWVPANPDHKKIGWTYDFDQIERIKRAAEKATGYDATMEIIQFVMNEADRRAATALRLSAGGGTTTARTLDEWHEDYGDAVWWTWQDGEWLGEPSYIGTPNDSDWPGYHTHWTPHPDFPAPPTVEAGR